MNETTLLAIFIVAVVVGLLATLAILRRGRTRESPFAVSTEGAKLCTACGFANRWIDRTCASCGASLPG